MLSSNAMFLPTSSELITALTSKIGMARRSSAKTQTKFAIALLIPALILPAFGQAPDLRGYRDVAMNRDGDLERGRQLFFDEARTGCSKCHSVDGSASKVGPDLYAAGDKFPRREIIQAVLEPSAGIAVGYGTTIIRTKSDDEFSGIIKEANDKEITLLMADGNRATIPAAEITEQTGSAVSLMPEGLQAALSREEFADLVQYVASLRQPENSLLTARGMPAEIPELSTPIDIRPFLNDDLRFPHAFVHKPGDVRSGLVWFSQAPGATNLFFVVHQTGKIWLLKTSDAGKSKSLFADFSAELFNERGPNGLLGMAFHPRFRENGRYFLKHQVFEDGKIATVLVEKMASADRLTDSGKPSRRLLKIVSVTQDHSGGCIEFGPDGYLYLGMGDTGPQQDPEGHGQDMQTLLGKIIRIDVDNATDEGPYSIPKDNPFINISGARPEIWASGFREPWRFTFDRETGDLWVGDVGQDRVEEAAIVRRGENHGWNVYEGFEPFSNRYRKSGETYVPPVFAYRRKYGNSITGGYVYRADKNSSFYGIYICGDYTSHRIFGVRQANRTLVDVRQIGMSPQNIASFGTDANGEIYIVGYEGMIYKLDFSNARFPGGITAARSKL
jgi:putative heme-binding domain-containing protein